MVHDHEFLEYSGRTLMKDRLEFKSPFGFLGWIVDKAFLGSYMRQFLIQRNQVLKQMAESTEWYRYLKG